MSVETDKTRDHKQRSRSRSRGRHISRSRSGSGDRSHGRSRSRSRSRDSESGGDRALGRKMWVGGLPRDCRSADLEEAFLPAGKAVDVKIRSSLRDTYAFFLFYPATDACKADPIAVLENLPVLGRHVKANFARSHGEPDRSQPRSYLSSRDHGPTTGGRRSPPRGGPPPPPPGGFPHAGHPHGGIPHHGHPLYTPMPMGYYPPPAGLYPPPPGYGGAPGMGGGGVGFVRLRVENLPEDMEWRELKSVVSDYAEVSFTKTWREEDGRCAGIVEVGNLMMAERLISALDGKRMEGCRDRLKLAIDRTRLAGGGDSYYPPPPQGSTIPRRKPTTSSTSAGNSSNTRY